MDPRIKFSMKPQKEKQPALQKYTHYIYYSQANIFCFYPCFDIVIGYFCDRRGFFPVASLLCFLVLCMWFVFYCVPALVINMSV
jgi:hypothetical protein